MIKQRNVSIVFCAASIYLGLTSVGHAFNFSGEHYNSPSLKISLNSNWFIKDHQFLSNPEYSITPTGIKLTSQVDELLEKRIYTEVSIYFLSKQSAENSPLLDELGKKISDQLKSIKRESIIEKINLFDRVKVKDNHDESNVALRIRLKSTKSKQRISTLTPVQLAHILLVLEGLRDEKDSDASRNTLISDEDFFYQLPTLLIRHSLVFFRSDLGLMNEVHDLLSIYSLKKIVQKIAELESSFLKK